MTQFLEIKADLQVEDTGEITGLAWPWGIPDRVGDVMTKGALTAPDQLPMLWSHDQSTVIGVWSDIRNTAQGVEVKGRLLIDDISKAKEVHALIKSKAVNGLSIGFETKDSKRHTKGRTISKANLLEISIVAVPCHPDAQITSLKSDGTEPILHKDILRMENEEIEQVAATIPANDAPQIDTKAFDEIKARLDKMEAKSNRPQGVQITSPAIHNVDETKAFDGYLRNGDASEIKTLSYGSGTGGILAPETVSKTILEKIAEFSPVRTVAQTIQMAGPLLQLPRLVDEVNPAAVAEGATKPDSEPTFEQIDLKPFEMGVVVPASKVLLEDSHIDLSGYLGNHIARRFGQLEAAAFVNGDGTTQAEGILNSAEVANTNVAPSQFGAEALMDQFYGIATAYSANGTWLMNRKTMAQVRKLKDSDGAFIWQGGIAAGQPATLLGRPVLEAVNMPDPEDGNSPVVFGDFATGYAIADRVGFEVIRDELTMAAQGVVKFVARRRVGGRVIQGEALTKLSLVA